MVSEPAGLSVFTNFGELKLLRVMSSGNLMPQSPSTVTGSAKRGTGHPSTILQESRKPRRSPCGCSLRLYVVTRGCSSHKLLSNLLCQPGYFIGGKRNSRGRGMAWPSRIPPFLLRTGLEFPWHPRPHASACPRVKRYEIGLQNKGQSDTTLAVPYTAKLGVTTWPGKSTPSYMPEKRTHTSIRNPVHGLSWQHYSQVPNGKNNAMLFLSWRMENQNVVGPRHGIYWAIKRDEVLAHAKPWMKTLS